MSDDTPFVTIGSDTYEVYADVTSADYYLAASITSDGVAWRAATADTKARALVTSTRWIDSAEWQGSKAVDDQPLAWPRSGISGVDSDAWPTAITESCIEMAARLVADPDLRKTQKEAIARSLKAGSVAIEYWRGQDVQTLTFFPTDIMKAIGQWLTGANALFGGGIATGTDGESAFEEGYDFNRGY